MNVVRRLNSIAGVKVNKTKKLSMYIVSVNGEGMFSFKRNKCDGNYIIFPYWKHSSNVRDMVMSEVDLISHTNFKARERVGNSIISL